MYAFGMDFRVSFVNGQGCYLILIAKLVPSRYEAKWPFLGKQGGTADSNIIRPFISAY